ncbi:MAG: class I SAM-dependent methyltransferase [Trueperaceae bacterium]|nr:class I SAM-dependent methyltransferase [Trueperaceae bacterium]
MPAPTLPSLLDAAFAARSALVDEAHDAAFRLFNGHLEGDPRWVVDLYGSSAVIYHHAAPLADVETDHDTNDDAEIDVVVERLQAHLPWLQAVVLKEREGTTDRERHGRIVWRRSGGAALATDVREHGVRYAVDLTMNQDAGFYLDTRALRGWLIDDSDGKAVLNAFAYTGSLGVAARAGGAARVLQTDLNPRFLRVAERSCALNGFPIGRKDLRAQDFWSFVRGAKLQGEAFHTVILDPPFFSATRGGTIDMTRDAPRLINKVRPLVRSGGTLAIVNNALFLSGAAFLEQLRALCEGGWMTIERFLDAPEDVTGYPGTRRRQPVVDPAPFAHSTKIALLSVRHR